MPDEPADIESNLGPATLPEFADAMGLGELKGRRERAAYGPPAASATAPSSPAPAAPVSPPVDYERLILKLFQTVDAAASVIAGVERESESDLEVSASCVSPWVTRHAGDAQSETAIRLLALAGILTFIATKVIRWTQKPAPVARPDVATAATDDLTPASLRLE